MSDTGAVSQSPEAGLAPPPDRALAPNAPVPLPLPPDLVSWRAAAIPSDELASTLDHMTRMGRIENYRRIKVDYKHPLTIEEMRHLMTLLGAQRAETLRQKRSESAAAKKASAGPAKQISLEDL